MGALRKGTVLMAFDKQLVKKSENLSEWYNKIILSTELADYGPAKGTMIFRPYGYAIWELVRDVLDPKLKDHGVSNAYFPLFIPSSFLEKEKKHLEGFSPELAVVTIGGGETLEEPLIVRPTSETIMYDAYSRWIQSYRDLPLLINQWNNVVRWEKRTYMFMRTTEFLWQEGHTAHATHDEAIELQKWAMDTYVKIFRDVFATPGYAGAKSVSETFAGADSTLTYETLMPEGKALQSGTSHDLGQNFSKAFDVSFQNSEGKKDYVWQTSWAITTRTIGGLIMVHGDDKGLRLPPKLAPVQVVILPVKLDDVTSQYCHGLLDQLKDAGIRAHIDDRDGESIGFKINKWEQKGAPIRIEVGPKEIESKSVTLSRRDKDGKASQSVDTLNKEVAALLVAIQANLLDEAQSYLDSHTYTVNSWAEFKSHMGGDKDNKGFLRALWCEDELCEAAIKEETRATTRCLPLDAKPEKGECIHCGKPAEHRWLFAQSY